MDLTTNPLGPVDLLATSTESRRTVKCVGPPGSSKPSCSQILINNPNPAVQISSVWRIPIVSRHEKLFGYHPTQKPLRLVRRALLASARAGDLVFGPFVGSGTMAVATNELDRA